MKISPIRLLIAAIILLFPVVLWNELLLDYVNKSGKLLVWILTPVWAFISTYVFIGSLDYVRIPIYSKKQWNPFWCWFIVSLAIEIFITATSNT